MKTSNSLITNKPRVFILIGCLALGAVITAGMLLALGAVPALGAHVNEPNVPDALARCHPDYTGPNRWKCEDVENPIFGVDNLTDRYFRYNPGGSPCLAFGNDGLYYACYNKTLDEWVGADGSSNILVDSSPLVGEYAALDFNDDGVPFISYYDAINAALKLAYYNAGSWTIETIVTTATSCPWVNILPRGSAQAPDSQGDSSSVRTFSKENTLESASRVLAPQVEPLKGVGKYTSVSVDDKNNVHISFQDEASRTLKYYFWDTGAVERCRTIDDVGEPDYKTGLWTSIATYGTEPRIHISYFHDIYDQLRYARSIEYDKFEIHEITGRNLPAHGNGPYSSIAVDSDGTSNISYYRWFRDNPNKGELWRAHIVGEGNGNCGENNYWQCDKLTNAGDQGGYTSISIDDDDDERISYYDFNNQDLKMWGPNGGTIDYEHNVGLFTSMDTYTDTIGIAYIDATDGQLIVVQKEGGEAWEKLGALDYVTTQSDVGLYTSLAIRQWDNIPFISYYNNSNDFLKYAWRVSSPQLQFGTPNDWTIGTVTGDYTAGTYSSIAISDSLPVIGLYNTEDRDLMFAEWSASSNKWYSEEVDIAGDVGQFVDLAISSDNIPHMSYYDASNENLNYAYLDKVTSEWMTRTWDTSALDGMFTSIDLSPEDKPYIAFYDYTNHEINLVYQTPLGGWSAPVVIDTGIGKIDRPPEDIEAYLSLDYEDVPSPGVDQVHISYYDATTQPNDVKDLKYWVGKVNAANGLPTQEDKLTIDSTGDVGKYNSIGVFDPRGDRYICYYDETNGFLKVAEWLGNETNPKWKNFVVDNNNRDTGLYCSTAFGSTGMVGISYYDKTRGTLRFAYYFPNYLYGPIIIK
jgi:hypothetical protein